jgi:alcohol dehydrogenase (cytochrome c)
MKAVGFAVLFAAACPLAALAQSADEIKKAEATPENILTYGMSYSQQRFSPLTEINRDTVKRLVPVWSYSMNNNTGEESQPLIYNGVMYITSQDKTVAIAVKSSCTSKRRRTIHSITTTSPPSFLPT